MNFGALAFQDYKGGVLKAKCNGTGHNPFGPGPDHGVLLRWAAGLHEMETLNDATEANGGIAAFYASVQSGIFAVGATAPVKVQEDVTLRKRGQ